MYENQITLYGISDYSQAINRIIAELEAYSYEFDMKIILTEAISNAFYHGNLGNEKLPIYITYSKSGQAFTFEIEDCGIGLDNGELERYINETDIFSEKHRGLFLISCYSDNVKFTNSKLMIKKLIK